MNPILTPEDLAAVTFSGPDDPRWDDVAALYDLQEDFVQLNFGYFHPALKAVNDAEAEAVRTVNRQGAYYKATLTEPRLEEARTLLGMELGVPAEQVAVVRSSSEAINMVLQGWPLQAGDEVVASSLDYTASSEVLEQRARLEGIVVRRVDLPRDPQAPVLVEHYTALFTPRTRLVLVTDLVHLNGRRQPSLEIIRAARAQGIPVFVDAAHSFGQLDTQAIAQEASFFGSSLHKWLGAPLGTGVLKVAPDVLPRLRPLYGDVSHSDQDIRRLERLGDRPDATIVGLIEALLWHRALGWRAKASRLAWLHDRWASRILTFPGVSSLSPSQGQRSAIGSFQWEGRDPADVARQLWDLDRIYVVVVKTPWGPALRVVPGLATRVGDLDRFCEAMDTIRKKLSR